MHKPWYSFLYVKSPIAKILIGTLALLFSLVLLIGQGIIETPRMAAQTASWDGRSIEKGAEIFANNCSTCHGPDGKGLPGVAPALHSAYFFTNRLKDVGYAGSLHDYIAGTVASGRPSNAISQWAQRMPTWGSRYGGPLRDDQVESVTKFVLNWKEDALTQSPEEDPWQPFENAPTTTLTGTVAPPAAAGGPVEGQPRAPQDLFIAMGCSGCHMIDQDQTDSNRGVIAPNLGNLNEVAGTMVPGEDAPTYVHNSIVDPNAFVVEGYAPGVMPQNFKDRMSDEEIVGLANWLLEQSAAQ